MESEVDGNNEGEASAESLVQGRTSASSKTELSALFDEEFLLAVDEASAVMPSIDPPVPVVPDRLPPPPAYEGAAERTAAVGEPSLVSHVGDQVLREVSADLQAELPRRRRTTRRLVAPTAVLGNPPVRRLVDADSGPQPLALPRNEEPPGVDPSDEPTLEVDLEAVVRASGAQRVPLRFLKGARPLDIAPIEEMSTRSLTSPAKHAWSTGSHSTMRGAESPLTPRQKARLAGVFEGLEDAEDWPVFPSERKAPSSAEGPSSPQEQRGWALSPLEQRGWPSSPQEQRGGPSSPLEQRGGPSSPLEQRGGPSSPLEQRGGLSSPLEQGGGSWSPLEQGGGSWSPLEQGGGSWSPLEQRGGPSSPSEQGGGSWSPLEQRGGPSSPLEQRAGFSSPQEQRAGFSSPLEHESADSERAPTHRYPRVTPWPGEPSAKDADAAEASPTRRNSVPRFVSALFHIGGPSSGTTDDDLLADDSVAAGASWRTMSPWTRSGVAIAALLLLGVIAWPVRESSLARDEGGSVVASAAVPVLSSAVSSLSDSPGSGSILDTLPYGPSSEEKVAGGTLTVAMPLSGEGASGEEATEAGVAAMPTGAASGRRGVSAHRLRSKKASQESRPPPEEEPASALQEDTEPEPAPVTAAQIPAIEPRKTAASLIADSRLAFEQHDYESAFRLAMEVRTMKGASRHRAEALRLVARSGCRIGQREHALGALRKLPLLKRPAVRRDCRRDGERLGL